PGMGGAAHRSPSEGPGRGPGTGRPPRSAPCGPVPRVPPGRGRGAARCAPVRPRPRGPSRRRAPAGPDASPTGTPVCGTAGGGRNPGRRTPPRLPPGAHRGRRSSPGSGRQRRHGRAAGRRSGVRHEEPGRIALGAPPAGAPLRCGRPAEHGRGAGRRSGGDAGSPARGGRGAAGRPRIGAGPAGVLRPADLPPVGRSEAAERTGKAPPAVRSPGVPAAGRPSRTGRRAVRVLEQNPVRLSGPPRRAPPPKGAGTPMRPSQETLEFIEFMTRSGPRIDSGLPAAELRAALQERRTSPAGPEVALVRGAEAPGPAGPVPLRHYHPEPGAVLPGIVFFHGGGFVLGDLDSHDHVCRIIAAGTGASVVAVDYRLAPEDPFPAAAEDAFAAPRWVAANAGELGIEPGRLAVPGDGAGGNLAAVTAQLARDAGGPGLVFQALVYPVVDWTPDETGERYPSHRENGEDYFLTTGAMEWFCEQYLGSPADAADP